MLTAPEIVTDVLKLVAKVAKEGITTKELDEIAEKRIRELGGRPFNKGYTPPWSKVPYPATLCTGVNDIIGHGIPSDYKLKSGDLLSLDVGVIKDGWCGDGALTIGIGKISKGDKELLRHGKQALYAGIEKIRPGVKVGEITEAIENYVHQSGYVVNYHLVGHGIGKKMHMKPYIPHVKTKKFGGKLNRTLKLGEQVCLEPMVTKSDNQGFLQPDGWTWKTRDGGKSVVFEHQIEVIVGGYRILTEHLSA